MCADYRALNKITFKEKYPITQIDRLKDHRYFTSLNLLNGYYQVPLARDSKDKTALVTPNGRTENDRTRIILPLRERSDRTAAVQQKL